MKLTPEQAATLDILDQYVLPERQPSDIDAQQWMAKHKMSSSGAHAALNRLVNKGIMTRHKVRDPELGGRERRVYRLAT